MNRQRADAAAGLLVGAIVLGGAALVWDASRRQSTTDGRMGEMMGPMHGPDPLWIGVSTLLVVAVLVGVYLLVRPELANDSDRPRSEPPEAVTGESARTAEVPDATSGRDVDPGGGSGSTNPEANPTERALDLLPEDERRILEPVLASPGLTQIELRDRSSFSKSKVSQTVSDLEERGLLYREPQGRTYRIYPSADLGGERET